MGGSFEVTSSHDWLVVPRDPRGGLEFSMIKPKKGQGTCTFSAIPVDTMTQLAIILTSKIYGSHAILIRPQVDPPLACVIPKPHPGVPFQVKRFP